MFGESIKNFVADAAIDLSDYEDEDDVAMESQVDDLIGLQAGVEALMYDDDEFEGDDNDDDGSIETDIALLGDGSLFTDSSIYNSDADDEPDADIDDVDLTDPGDDEAEIEDDYYNSNDSALESIFDIVLESDSTTPQTVKMFSTFMDNDNEVTNHGPSSDDMISSTDDTDDDDEDEDDDNDSIFNDDDSDYDDDDDESVSFTGNDVDYDSDASMESVSTAFESALRELM